MASANAVGVLSLRVDSAGFDYVLVGEVGPASENPAICVAGLRLGCGVAVGNLLFGKDG